MQKIAVITGGGTGLGRAIAQQLAARDLKVFIIGRRKEKLRETQLFSKQNIMSICADISTVRGRNKILNQLNLNLNLKNIKINYLIHNAAIFTPITALKNIALKEFRKIQAINLEAPLFLTQLLLSHFNPEARILHISSDCAHYPLAYWIPYCVSKAGLFMAYQCLKKEFEYHHQSIYIGSVDPGMMDTPMQDYICHKKIKFPEKYTREELEAHQLIKNPEISAAYCVKLLLDMSVEEFSLSREAIF